MKRIILFSGILCIVFALLCCSCGLFGDRRYTCDVNAVESVQIVRLDKYVEGEYTYEYTVLCEITERSRFIEQLNDIKHSVNWGEPSQMDMGCVVIRIDYLNGDYDLLYPNAQCFHRSGVNQYGYFFFDKEQFDEQISDYITDNEITQGDNPQS